MSGLGFDDLRRANVERCEQVFHPLDDWSPTDWATALAGEVGEACNFVKKLRRLETSQMPTVRLLQTTDGGSIVLDVAKELADVVIYADLLAARLGIDLGAAVVRKFNTVSHRTGSTVWLEEPAVDGEGS